MSPCTYRSFVIHLLLVILISESPVSAFTIRRTTTLKNVDLDLDADGSALLEVKSDLSKLNNERDYVKFGARKSPIRNSANGLGADNKLITGGSKIVIQSTTVNLPNETDDTSKSSENKTMRIDKGTTARLIFERGQKFKAKAESSTNAATEKDISNSTQNLDTTIPGTEHNAIGHKDNGSTSVNDSSYSSTNTERSETESSDTNEPHSQDTTFTTTDIPTLELKTVTESYKSSSTEAGTAKQEINIHKIINQTTTPQTDTTHFETESTKLNDVVKDSIATDSTALTETMMSEFTSSPSKDPTWKKYTIIERKRTNPTTEADSLTTTSDELEKAESVSSNVTFENASSTTPQQHQERVSVTTITAPNTENLNVSSTLLAFNNVPENVTEQMPSTRPLSAETTTEKKPQDLLSSKRAGFLDLTVQQDADETTTIEQFDEMKFNETELIGSMFEIESQEDALEMPEAKNSSMVESQSQLADDAINEELLKEAVLSDKVENSNRYNEEQKDRTKVKPLEASSDDPLSVKPIGKSALYTSRSNYRPMKKIEVQSSKPFVRDPDDNSWRNESLSNLGIVFKAKNASKPFTQVLKNKTEAELNNWLERDNKNEVPDLRERLEKIAEVRKSKKKKLNQFGEMVYSDYEAENSGEASSTPRIDAIPVPVEMDIGHLFFDNPTTTAPGKMEAATQRTTTPGVFMYKEETETTTKKPKKMNKFAEYYDTTDEYDADYLSLSKIDLKKFTTQLLNKETRTTTPSTTMFTKPIQTMMPERKPTVQYFPPREPPRREPQKVNVNDYDSDFQKKVNMFAYNEPRKSSPISDTPPPATMAHKTTQYPKQTSVIPGDAHQYKPGNLAKNVYVTFPPRVVEHNNRYPSNDEGFNRASYVIKHFKDLIDEAVSHDYDKSGEFILPYTETPLMGVTTKEKEQMKPHMDDDYDYDANYRKDILNRFVENFNQNSERFKVDFPILYNSSVVHMQADDNGKVLASSSAFLKRQYGAAPAPAPGRPCCDMKVELSPAYELHYYVPEQEEKQEAERPATMPFSYRL